jgi:hypothetical protein
MKTRPTHTLLSCIATLVALGGCAADGSDGADKLDTDEPDQQANILFSECAPNPCANGGTCADTLLGFECACAGGFTGARCNVAPGAPPSVQPPVFPPLFPSNHKLHLSVQQTLPFILSKPEMLLGLDVTVNGQPCAGGACDTIVAAGADATVVVSVSLVSGADMPVLRGWNGCTGSSSSFEHVPLADDSNTLKWTTTFSNLDADKSCVADFALAAFFWFHLPAFGPSDAQAAPAQFCDHAVHPKYVPQIPAGEEAWSTSCVVPPGTTVTMTPIYKGRQLTEMVCMVQNSRTEEWKKIPFTSTPAVVADTRSGQRYECALEKVPE